MRLLDLIMAVQQNFPNADDRLICRTVNELEHRIRKDLFAPYGLSCRADSLHPETDMQTTLLLDSSYYSVYSAYVCSVLALSECDADRYNAFAALFTAAYEQATTDFRRAHLPRRCELIV